MCPAAAVVEPLSTFCPCSPPVKGCVRTTVRPCQADVLSDGPTRYLRAVLRLIDDPLSVDERGSDIRQVVNDRLYQNCGLILWECKNAKTYQTAWLGKLKDEMAHDPRVIVFGEASVSLPTV